MSLCTRCNKFPVNQLKSRQYLKYCRFCMADYSRSAKLFGSEFVFTPGSKRVWIGKGNCPIDLHLV